MLGVMLGSIIFGALSDKYGRKVIFFVSIVLQLASGVGVAFAPEYVSYVVFRVVVGSTTSGVFLVAYVIGECSRSSLQGHPLLFLFFAALEMVGPKKRTVAGVGCQLFFTSGYVITGIVAYYVRDWQTLQIVLTLPNIAFLIYWWWVWGLEG